MLELSLAVLKHKFTVHSRGLVSLVFLGGVFIDISVVIGCCSSLQYQLITWTVCMICIACAVGLLLKRKNEAKKNGMKT